jgi:flavin-dependent dehydrogenase
MTDSCDVAVVGGGPAGCAAAISIASRGYSVVVLERSQYEARDGGEIVPPATKQLLCRLGTWNAFLSDSPLSSAAIWSSWGGPSLAEQNHIYNPYGSGWTIDRGRFDAMLALAAQEAGAAVKTNADVVGVGCEPSGKWIVEFISGQRLEVLNARFVVDASGRSSVVARKIGFARQQIDALIGVVGSFDIRASDESTAPVMLLEAVENGWWYSAPLPKARLLVVFMTDADLYARGCRLPSYTMLDHLDRTVYTQATAANRQLASIPTFVAASTSRLNPASGDGWLAVGDAAAAIDPIAGQGVYRALQQGADAGALISDWCGGEVIVPGDYAAEMQRSFQEYMTLRSFYYCQEQRWPHSLFWKRRTVSWPAFNPA